MTDARINELANEAMGSIYTDDDEDYAMARTEIERVIGIAVKEEWEACGAIIADEIRMWRESGNVQESGLAIEALSIARGRVLTTRVTK